MVCLLLDMLAAARWMYDCSLLMRADCDENEVVGVIVVRRSSHDIIRMSVEASGFMTSFGLNIVSAATMFLCASGVKNGRLASHFSLYSERTSANKKSFQHTEKAHLLLEGDSTCHFGLIFHIPVISSEDTESQKTHPVHPYLLDSENKSTSLLKSNEIFNRKCKTSMLSPWNSFDVEMCTDQIAELNDTRSSGSHRHGVPLDLSSDCNCLLSSACTHPESHTTGVPLDQ
jgi:hypothetical protein